MEFTILIVGNAQVGKKCYLNRLLTGEFRSFLTTTSHILNTTLGLVKITYSISATVVDGYDGYIFMCDMSTQTADIVRGTSSIAVMAVNKCDRNITAQDHHTGLPTFTVSAKWNRGLYEPILYILRGHLGQSLRLIENEAIAPSNVTRRPRLFCQIFKY